MVKPGKIVILPVREYLGQGCDEDTGDYKVFRALTEGKPVDAPERTHRCGKVTEYAQQTRHQQQGQAEVISHDEGQCPPYKKRFRRWSDVENSSENVKVKDKTRKGPADQRVMRNKMFFL